MASLAELARRCTTLSRAQIDNLQRLVAEWGMLADFCFADLLLFAPTNAPGAGTVGSGDEPQELVVLAQVRPYTSQTVYRGDWVGQVMSASDRPLIV